MDHFTIAKRYLYLFHTILLVAYVWFTRICLFSMLRRTHFPQLLCRGTSSAPHISTDLEFDEASSAALVRMIVGCPQLTELDLIGSFKSFRSGSYYIQQLRLRISVIFVFSPSRYDFFRFVAL
jgi:hypothetical protein